MAVNPLGNGYTSGSSNSLSFNYSCHSGSDRKLLVAVTINATTPTISSVTYDGASLTQWFSTIQGIMRTSLYYLDDEDFPVSPGSYSVASSTGGTNPKMTIAVLEIENAVQGSLGSTASDGVDDGTPIDVSVSPTTDGALVFCWSGRSGESAIDTVISGTETYIYDDLEFDYAAFEAAYIIRESMMTCSCVVDISSANDLIASAVAVNTTEDPYSNDALFFGAGF